MRLGKDVLEADLYGELGLLPDATPAEIRVSYRARARASHPDLNPGDPEAAARMARLNVAAKVLLDPALRRAYDRPRSGKKTRPASAPPRSAWFEQREQAGDDDWSAPPSTARDVVTLWGELRGRQGRLSLRLHSLVESLDARQQLGVAAALVALALVLVAMAGPRGVLGDAPQPTSVNVRSVFP
jgi:curved DNA-binding protein CbpA